MKCHTCYHYPDNYILENGLDEDAVTTCMADEYASYNEETDSCTEYIKSP